MAYEVFIWTYFLCCTLIFFVIAFLDAKYFYISDLCLICLAIFAILKCIFLSQNEKLLLELCLSFTVTFLLFASVYRFCGGLGFGDVKYSCVLSLHFNLLKSLELFLFSTIFAIFYSVFLLKKELSTIDNRSIKIPYGTFLSIGAILFLSFSLCLPCTAQNVNEKEIQLEFFNQKNYIYAIPREHQENTRRCSNIPR